MGNSFTFKNEEMDTDFYRNTKFYKVTNEKEFHINYQYQDGLNILKDTFNDNKKSYCGGGFYFTTANEIFNYVHHGNGVREIFYMWMILILE
jgi:hypothetical protein